MGNNFVNGDYLNKSDVSYSVYIDREKTTSGQRFFLILYDRLLNKSSLKHSKIILFNISAPLSLIIKSKFKGQKVVIRVDSLYADRLSDSFINTFSFPLKHFLILAFRYGILRNAMSIVANFFNQNFKGFSRIIFADHIIYQSYFSYELYKMYFPRKKYSIICNGYFKQSSLNFKLPQINNKEIKLITTYDEGRPSKRIYDLICFMDWLENKNIKHIKLNIIGFNNNIPSAYPQNMLEIINNSTIIETSPRFKEINSDVINIFQSCDMYVTFSYNDACPNAVIEAMSMGLPVIGTLSGGILDIVGDAGILIALKENFSSFYPSRFENDFPEIDFFEVLKAIEYINENISFFKEKVDIRFNDFLDINIVAEKYEKVLLNVDN